MSTHANRIRESYSAWPSMDIDKITAGRDYFDMAMFMSFLG